MPAEGVGSDLGSVEDAEFDALAVNSRDVQTLVVEVGQDLLNGVEKFFWINFARALGVAALLGFCDSVLTVVIPPGLDGSPGELIGVTFFIPEDLLTDADVAFLEAVSVGELKSAEDFHFEVR